MSSPMKDARWVIAMRRAEELGQEWDLIPYTVRDRLLADAQLELDPLSATVIRLIAESGQK